MAPRQRIDQQPGFVLHTYPYRETSLIVEMFSRDYGRLALMAKGARRPMSALRGVLMAFQPLLVDWSGGGEVKTLVRAEWVGGQPMLAGRALLCGYYLNELLVKMMPREDAHAELFETYATTIARLPGQSRFEPLLRQFELSLLEQLGYGVPLAREADSGAPVEADVEYRFIIDRGAVRVSSTDDTLIAVSGQTLIDMAANRFDSARTLQQSKALLRQLIQHHMGGQTLQSRRVFKELQTL